jgi:glycosyltransferase involved in cell wall biosynthesis
MGFKGNIMHLPNLIEVEGFQPSYDLDDESIVYVGRLSPEKGLDTLLDAVRGMDVHLKIVGDGPVREELEAKAERDGLGNVEFLGYKKGAELHKELRDSMAAVLPSEWYENNPLAIIEAFAMGKPVIGARIGGIPELVRDWETGLTFEPGNVDDLKEKISLAIENKEKLPAMGERARRFVERELNPEVHYEKLMKVYKAAINKEARG